MTSSELARQLAYVIEENRRYRSLLLSLSMSLGGRRVRDECPLCRVSRWRANNHDANCPWPDLETEVSAIRGVEKPATS